MEKSTPSHDIRPKTQVLSGGRRSDSAALQNLFAKYAEMSGIRISTSSKRMKHSRVQLKASRFQRMAVNSLPAAQAVKPASITWKTENVWQACKAMQWGFSLSHSIRMESNSPQAAFDGKIRIFDPASGKLLNAFMSVPIEPEGSEDVALVVTGMT